jgi:hypothetical protein
MISLPRWQQMTLMTMSNLIIPYLTSAILVALSIAFRFLQVYEQIDNNSFIVSDIFNL